jgi:hypothetical protein
MPVGTATVAHRPDAVRMDAYPLLAYGPRSAPAVRVASVGVPVAEILEARDRESLHAARAAAAADAPSHDVDAAILRRFRLAPEELAEVLRWQADPERPGA